MNNNFKVQILLSAMVGLEKAPDKVPANWKLYYKNRQTKIKRNLNWLIMQNTEKQNKTAFLIDLIFNFLIDWFEKDAWVLSRNWKQNNRMEVGLRKWKGNG